MNRIRFYPLGESDFESIILLGAQVHGTNYLSQTELETVLDKSKSQGINCSLVAYDGPREENNLIGFRLTYAPGKWEPDKWCSVNEWNIEPDEVCYFKSNTLDSGYRGQGIGQNLLQESIQYARLQGAKAGVTHIWMQSPGNSAYRYFTKAGGHLIRIYPDRWREDIQKSGYNCIIDGNDCHCDGAEMILYFEE